MRGNRVLQGPDRFFVIGKKRKGVITMKKAVSLALAALLVGIAVFSAFAADGVNVAVTVCDGGTVPALACASVQVADRDSDGALTIYDALYCAHEQYCDGGADGFGTALTDYGVSLTKLWGRTSPAGYGFGYYVNDEAAWSLTDPVKDGDYVAAFLYTDAVNFSDAYAYFNVKTAAVAAGKPLTLTLAQMAYVPPEWVLVSSPAANAVILIDGEETALTADKDGKVEVTFDGAGAHLVSARAQSGLIVPPACLVTVVEGGLPGDVDRDGSVTSEDARLALRASVKLETLEAAAFVNADVTGDGVVTPEDARKILRASVHLETL